MNFTVSVDISAEELSRLGVLLGCGQADLPGRLTPFAEAAFREYVSMLAGSRSFSRASDYQEERLLRFIKHVNGDRVPSEQLVSRLFHLTRSQARTLIRNTVTKFSFELSSTITATVTELLKGAERIADSFYIKTQSSELVDEINRILGASDPNFKGVAPELGTLGRYAIQITEMEGLCNQLGIDIDSIKRRGG